MYKKSDILHEKYYMCLRRHRYRVLTNSESKKGFRLISYLAFLNLEYSNYKRYENTNQKKFKDQRQCLYEIIETMNLVCNKYLNL